MGIKGERSSEYDKAFNIQSEDVSFGNYSGNTEDAGFFPEEDNEKE